MKQILLMIAVVALVGCRTAKPTSDPNAVGDQGATNKPTNKPLPEDFDSLKALAEQGVAKAQYNLGNMYRKGQEVEQDFKETVKWYRKAADQGFARAQSNLAVMYANGQGVKQDLKEAFKWCHKAAEQEDARAQYNLGQMYGYGKGVEPDLKESFRWFNKSAEQGDALA